jgi:hypothetical protein
MGALPLVVFPDVNLYLTGYLRAGLAELGAPAFVSTKREDRARWVWVRRDGGPRLDLMRDGPRVTINVGATDPTGKAVNDLAELVRALMVACPGDVVKRCRNLSGPSEVDDPTGQPRRVMSFELITVGQVMTNP